MDSCCLGDVEQATVECRPVLRHIFAGGPAAAGHTDAQFLQAHYVAAVPESVQPAHSLRSSIINRLLQNEHRLWKIIEFNIPSIYPRHLTRSRKDDYSQLSDEMNVVTAAATSMSPVVAACYGWHAGQTTRWTPATVAEAAVKAEYQNRTSDIFCLKLETSDIYIRIGQTLVILNTARDYRNNCKGPQVTTTQQGMSQSQ